MSLGSNLNFVYFQVFKKGFLLLGSLLASCSEFSYSLAPNSKRPQMQAVHVGDRVREVSFGHEKITDSPFISWDPCSWSSRQWKLAVTLSVLGSGSHNMAKQSLLNGELLLLSWEISVQLEWGRQGSRKAYFRAHGVRWLKSFSRAFYSSKLNILPGYNIIFIISPKGAVGTEMICNQGLTHSAEDRKQ